MNRIIKIISLAALSLAAIVICLQPQQKGKDPYALPELCPALKNELFGYIVAAYQTPEEYLISKFTEHDIVFIGEFHRIKQNVLLMQNLIPKLHEHGIYNLGMEFARYEDQSLIDSLITSESYDESLALTLLFNQSPFWGFQEYADIFRAAWEINMDLKDDEQPFRIVGLNVKADWSHVTCAEDRENPEVMKRVWLEGNSDEFMAATIIKEFVDTHEKALIYTGVHHAFTEYKQSRINAETLEPLGSFEDRAGNLVYSRIGKKAITVIIHAPWINERGYAFPSVYPVDGMIDALLASLPVFYRNVGFDVKTSPFGSLPAKNTMYKYGYNNFSLSDFCDGYICQCAISEYTGVTPIEHFITEENLSQAKLQSPNPEFKADSITPEFFNAAIKMDADIPSRFGDFK
jgi:hypothetical protein